MATQHEVDAIFNDWLDHRRGLGLPVVAFTRCGPINLELWNAARPRVLFLLAEAWLSDDSVPPEDWDLCRWIRSDYPRAMREQTLRRLAQWAYGAHSIGRHLDQGAGWPNFPGPGDESQLLMDFQSCAILETKICARVGMSDMIEREVNEAAAQDEDYLLRALELFDPDLVICGGRYYHSLWPLPGFDQAVELYQWCHEEPNGRPWIRHHHPNRRYWGADDLYFATLSTVRGVWDCVRQRMQRRLQASGG